MTNDLKLATEAAMGAGQILLEFWKTRESLEISSKRAGDFVSKADLAAEEFLKKTLLKSSEDAWLGEETGSSGDADRRWIVDPLDGTTNFLRGIPHWAVSVALEIKGELSIGVVYDPVKRETFAAELGKGARLNDSPIAVSETKDLTSALFGTGVPFGEMPHINDHASEIARLMPHCAGVRRMGAAALDLAYVASGRLDGFWERRLQLWDMAAGLVIASEAGAKISGWDESDSPEKSGNVIAGTPELFEKFSKLIIQSR